MSNKVQPITAGNSQFFLCGLDDYWERKTQLNPILNDLPKTGCAILLVPEPDYAEISALTGRFDLQISGHSHGGQVCIPLLGSPLYHPMQRSTLQVFILYMGCTYTQIEELV